MTRPIISESFPYVVTAATLQLMHKIKETGNADEQYIPYRSELCFQASFSFCFTKSTWQLSNMMIESITKGSNMIGIEQSLFMA